MSTLLMAVQVGGVAEFVVKILNPCRLFIEMRRLMQNLFHLFELCERLMQLLRAGKYQSGLRIHIRKIPVTECLCSYLRGELTSSENV